jgi:DNA mismatch repair protein MutL
MPEIMLLNQETIDKIAAGEVVERPSSVVKELVENAIDAKATAVTVEIKEGGISFIRITDNGCGIEKKQVPIAFLRHSTSKIRSVEDLLSIHSLGFRGEALSSIAAVSQVELITKTYDELTGTRYVIEGSKEVENEEIGAPEGTTFIVRNLFYNVPARRKFLKTAQTEAGYISDLMERMALSHPDVSFKFINNGQTKLHTSGNGNEKDLIYHIYGRDITSAVLKVEHETELFKLRGFIGKPIISRGNRNYENYFINGRYIKSALIAKSIEEAYKGFMMQHQYPFCVLYFEMNSGLLDVNVHPTKMELRFSQNEEIYRSLFEIIRNTISHRDFIPEVPVQEEKKETIPSVPKHTPEPFEIKRRNQEAFFEKMKQTNASPLTVQEENLFAKPVTESDTEKVTDNLTESDMGIVLDTKEVSHTKSSDAAIVYEQQNLEQLDSHFLTKDARKKHKIIGQLFDTYWLIEYEDKLFIIDQHAAHEKVLYERTMKRISDKNFSSQTISPPIILTLSNDEVQALETYAEQLTTFGYEIEPFGGKEYAITAIPADFTDIDMKTMFIEMLDDFANISGRDAPNLIMEKAASMSCKAAVKGNNHLSRPEIEALIDELLELDNPYNCPHGRPTIISMTKYEIEKKFRRIV